jgi:hypothetical protein
MLARGLITHKGVVFGQLNHTKENRNEIVKTSTHGCHLRIFGDDLYPHGDRGFYRPYP